MTCSFHEERMAALRVPFQSLSLSKTSSVILTRSASGGNKKWNGRETWQPRRVPSGQTQYANLLVKLGHRQIWRERQEYVNKGWKQTLLEISQNKTQLEENVEKEPPKLLMVRRVKTTAGRPFWEKNHIKGLKLENEKTIQIFVNSQNNIGHLKKVSHLIEVLPISFPHGLPETEEDFEHCVLCDNGEFIVKKRLESSHALGIETTTEIPENKWQITEENLDRTLELKKQKYQIHQEYYPTAYIWKRNEDGKEMRYKGNTNIGSDKIWY